MRGKRGIRRPLCTCETLCERRPGMSFIWMAMSFCRSQMRGLHNRHGLGLQPSLVLGQRGVAGRQVCGLRAAQRRRQDGTDAILIRPEKAVPVADSTKEFS